MSFKVFVITIIMIVMFNASAVMASGGQGRIPELPSDLIEGRQWVVVQRNGDYRLYIPQNGIGVERVVVRNETISGKTGYLLQSSMWYNKGTFLMEYVISNGEWVYRDYLGPTWVGGGENEDTIIMTNYDIIIKPGGAVFFTQRVEFPSLLPQYLEGVRMEETMSQVVGLLPLLIPLLVSFLALRKGLVMLFLVLRTS